jgi:single-strand DNA-binding protein
MSRGFSRVVLVGNLGRDPEMRYSQNGTPITNFTIAVNRRRRNPDGTQHDETDWYRISLFRNQAENAAEWLRKGNKVLVEGQLQIRTYTGQDGIERTSVEVNADSFLNLTARDDMGEGGFRQPAAATRPAQGGQPGRRQEQAAEEYDDLDDVPF